MELFQVFIELAQSTVRVSTPLILAALAGLFTERAGVFDIGLEGKMLGAAFAAGAVAYITQSVMMGLLAAILISVLLSLVHGYASITQRGNQIVSGVAINFVVAGATVILGQAWFKQGGRTPALSADGRFVGFESQASNLVEDLTHVESNNSVKVSYDLWDMPFNFLMAVALAAAEWFIRKRKGLA